LTHSLTGITQNHSDFETELIKYHGTKDTLVVVDELWIYDKTFNKIKEVKLEIFKEPNVKTYLVDMVWYLGYHVNDVQCLFKFNTETKEIEFTGELWSNGFKTRFFKEFIGYPLSDKNAVNKFIAEFEKLLQANNPNIKFSNIYKEKKQTVIYMTQLTESNDDSKLLNIIVLHHPKPWLYKIVVFNTMGSLSIIEK